MSLLLRDRQDIRTHIRHLRRELSHEQQQLAAVQVADHALNFAPVQQAKNIALFLSVDGEINTRPLIAKLWQRKQRVYLPVLHPFSRGQLLFLRYDEHTELRNNRLRIPEPPLDIRHLLPLSELDVLMVPLVAFDAGGQRLGMGAGFMTERCRTGSSTAFCRWVWRMTVSRWNAYPSRSGMSHYRR